MTVNTTIRTGLPRFFKVELPGVTKGDIIAFFPGEDRGRIYFIRARVDTSEWGGLALWTLDEMTPDYAVEMTKEQLLAYCPAAAVPPPEVFGVLEERYHELLYSVASKFPGETRHQTALRYIREAEAQAKGAADAEARSDRLAEVGR